MRIKLGYELVFDVPAPTPMVLMLYLHPSRWADAVRPDNLLTEPAVPIQTYLDPFGNRCGRVVAPAGKFRIHNDLIVRDSGLADPVTPDAIQHPVDELPVDVMQFLLASRYCEVDKMVPLAWELFGKTRPGWERVQAICDWAHERITFNYQDADSTRTACGAYEQRKGVCRDYMHLAITMCRAMNIPARYCTGYLGDIGIPPAPYPMDFSAWFEAYLGGKWHTFDARHNVPRIGRVLMARGRDAVDVALTTSFGDTKLEKFLVWTDEVVEDRAAQAQDAVDDEVQASPVSVYPAILADGPQNTHVFL